MENEEKNEKIGPSGFCETCPLKELRDQVANVPLDMVLHANVFTTDTKKVIHLWDLEGNAWDLTIDRKDHLETTRDWVIGKEKVMDNG